MPLSKADKEKLLQKLRMEYDVLDPYGLTPEELASIIGVDRKNIQRLEEPTPHSDGNVTRVVNPFYLEALSLIYYVDPYTLLGLKSALTKPLRFEGTTHADYIMNTLTAFPEGKMQKYLQTFRKIATLTKGQFDVLCQVVDQLPAFKYLDGNLNNICCEQRFVQKPRPIDFPFDKRESPEYKRAEFIQAVLFEIKALHTKNHYRLHRLALWASGGEHILDILHSLLILGEFPERKDSLKPSASEEECGYLSMHYVASRRRDAGVKVFHNGKVYTGSGFAQAFAVEDGKFTFVGSNSDSLFVAGERIDLGGAFVCAGFNDSHMHLLSYGQALSMAPLAKHTSSLVDMLDCLRAAKPDRGWILGRGWNQDFFSDVRRMPSRQDLDRVSTEFPVCATRACGHALVVNTKALEVLGIGNHTPSPEGGEIDFENGRFFDNAMDMVLGAIPAPDKETLKGYIRAACRELNRRGITSCHSDDYCVSRAIPWQTVNEAYRELEVAGELTVRVREQANLTTVPELMAFIEADHPATGRFSMGPLKLLGDGALGARTAFLSRSYADEPGTRGLSVFTAEQFDELIGCAHAHGMQVAVHCIGDACLDLVLDAIEKAQAAHPRDDARHGIVHCQITRPDQLERIARNRLHVYAQSIFLDYDIHIVHERAGDELARSSYSWKTLLDTGATVSNGSDCPVEYPDVMAGIQCAVTRSDLKGHGPYLPDQAFSVREALDSFTKAGAYASFEEHTKGQIQPGMLADFVLLGADPFDADRVEADRTGPKLDPARLKDIRILETWLEGEQVWRFQDPCSGQ